jgi:hypothetical protein
VNRAQETGGNGPLSAAPELYVVGTAETSVAVQCAQELFSLFVFAIAAEITKIGGKTTRLPHRRGQLRRWNNTLLTALAEQAVQTRLAPDLETALTLVVPAFAHYDLLPTVSEDGTQT